MLASLAPFAARPQSWMRSRQRESLMPWKSGASTRARSSSGEGSVAPAIVAWRCAPSSGCDSCRLTPLFYDTTREGEEGDNFYAVETGAFTASVAGQEKFRCGTHPLASSV